MEKIGINIIGIALNTIGTVFTLLSILTTDPQKVGTWGYLADMNREFKKEKKKVIIGCTMIVIGGAIQIFGQLI